VSAIPEQQKALGPELYPQSCGTCRDCGARLRRSSGLGRRICVECLIAVGAIAYLGPDEQDLEPIGGYQPTASGWGTLWLGVGALSLGYLLGIAWMALVT